MNFSPEKWVIFSRIKASFTNRNAVMSERNSVSHGSQQLGPDEMKTTNLAPDDNARTALNVDFSQMSFHQVAREGDVSLILKLLERITSNQQRKKKINQKDEAKLAPLHYASRYSHYKIMKILIDNGADVRLKGDDDATPLHFLAKYKKKSMESASGILVFKDDDLIDDESNNCVRLLITNGANVNARDAMGLTPLHQACSRNNIKMVREILQFPSTQLEVFDNQGMTALHLACLYSRKEIVKLLLDAGAELRSRDKELTTPFHLSCAEGSIEIAQILLDKADKIARTSEKGDQNVIVTVDENTKTSDLNFKKWKISPNNSELLEKKNKSSGSHSFSKQGKVDLLKDTDNEKNLPLHLAIENGHLKLVKLCVEEGKKTGYLDMIKICRSQNDSCLHLAVQSNNLEIVQFLLNEGIDVNARNSFLTTPLMIGCYQNAYKIVGYLLKNGANLELKNSDFMTPLMIACKFGHYETIQCLLEHGANVTETDKDDKTCLMFAAEENKTEALMLLLKNKVMSNMIEERDKFNNTALHLASMKGHQETVKLLLDHRAAADTKNEDDRTTLHMAALYGHEVIIPDLISKDRTIINSNDEESNTALHLAAIGGNLKCVTSLVKSGANMEILNAKQWRPLDAAAANGWEKIVLVLMESGTNIEPRGKIKVSPLHLACQRGHVNVVKILLNWKADVTFKSSDGRNALDFAIDFGQKECVLALIKHETWQLSMNNAMINPVTGRMITPMRKLIMKMADMALIVCDQCITDNGKKPENDDYAVTLSYELLDDMYSGTIWLERTKEKIGNMADNSSPDDYNFSIYDENDELTFEARTYSKNADILHRNHPLHIMVENGSQSLLLHPVVTGLLNHKWRTEGRYIYYINLLLYVTYLLTLNCYMLLQPPYYRLDWVKVIEFRRFLSNNRTATGLNINESYLKEFKNDSPECWYYRSEVVDNSPFNNALTKNCTILPSSVRHLRGFLLAFAIFHLLREGFQLINKKLAYFNLTNLVEVTLYVLSLLIPLQFSSYTFIRLDQLTAGNLTARNVSSLVGFQQDTGLRQEWQQQIGAFSVFLSWMVLLLFIRKVPRLGIFVVMFTDILRTFSEFFVVFAFFILAFSLSFTILLGNQHEFEQWYEALLKTTVMMIGELNYAMMFYGASESINDIGRSYHHQVYPREITFILFFIFLLVVTIIIMNLLVGLAVGDIIQVRQNATLETVGMQVDLTLDVEFSLPSFLRKKFFRRKQRIEPNKYRHSNFLKKFFLQDKDFLESISEALGDEEKEQDEPKTAENKVISGLNLLRVRLSDVLAEQADLRQDVRGIRSLVRQTQLDATTQTNLLRDNIEATNSNITTKIDTTRSGLTETTQVESLQIRHKVDGTNMVINMLKDDLANTKQGILVIKSDLEKKIEDLHEEIISKSWKNIDIRMQECNNRVEEIKKEVVGALDDVKLLLVKEKCMTRV